MSEIRISSHVIQAIKNHAKNYPTIEIYGWLLGYDIKDTLFVISSVPCKQYKLQNQIVAEPYQDEVMEISKAIPKGLGIVGIYHSHVGEVFHSTTDDNTIRQFSSVYPKFLSIVTNSEEIKYYQLHEKNVEETIVSIIKEINFIQFEISTILTLSFKAPKDYSLSFVSSQLREILTKATIKQMQIDDKLIDLEEKVKKFKGKKINVILNIPEEYEILAPEDEQLIDLEIKLVLSGNLILPEDRQFSFLKSMILQTLLDDMYYKLKNYQIKRGAFVSPSKEYVKINGLIWKFYIKKGDKEGYKKFLASLLFKLENMSFKEKGKQKKLIQKYKNELNKIS
ncbi:MAG: Mov34/MPN/PAD-1 family protein [Candidatus Heimdallarchaeaceae archaeon]